MSVGLAAAFFVSTTPLRAQERFGTKGQLAITAENLFEFSSEKLTQPDPTGDQSVTSNRFGFLWSSRGDVLSPRGPQVGGHYFVIPSLSIGGTIGYESRGSTVGARGVSRDGGSTSSFVLLPKVGYALMLNDTIGFWFRGGPGFTRVGTDDNNGTTTSLALWTLAADALFVVTPVTHFGFYIGPQGEISFTGSQTTTNNRNGGLSVSRDTSFRSLSLGVGVLGYFGL